MNSLTSLAASTLLCIAASAGAADSAQPINDKATAAPVTLASASLKSVPIDPRFAAMDKDGDGSLLQGDFPAGHDLGTDLFASFDTDSDQRMSRAEFTVYAGGNVSDAASEEEEEEAE